MFPSFVPLLYLGGPSKATPVHVAVHSQCPASCAQLWSIATQSITISKNVRKWDEEDHTNDDDGDDDGDSCDGSVDDYDRVTDDDDGELVSFWISTSHQSHQNNDDDYEYGGGGGGGDGVGGVGVGDGGGGGVVVMVMVVLVVVTR